MQVAQIIRTAGDVTAYSAIIAALLGWLPQIAAGFSIIWISMQMLEKITGKTINAMLRNLCGRIHRAWDTFWL